MSSLPEISHPDLLVGFDNADDAGVFRMGEDLALVQTVDFITPVVDDPFSFGMIAAANSLSDVYAMGGEPVTAMNIICFPAGRLPMEVVGDILRGGLEKIVEAGAVLVGGHSVEDPEIKYGLSVTGKIHPDKVVTNRGGRPGDRVILTKPLGTGIVATAVKGGLAEDTAEKALTASASTLNRTAAEVMAGYGVTACTDVTGFGLGGHLAETARASGLEISVSIEGLPLLEGVIEYAGMGMIPAGCHENRKYFSRWVEVDGDVDPCLSDVVFDPQTSGGLLIFLPPGEAGDCLGELIGRGVEASVIIGEVTGETPDGRVIVG